MKKRRFWLLSLVVWLTLGVCLHWPPLVRIAVILHSILLLSSVLLRIKEQLFGQMEG